LQRKDLYYGGATFWLLRKIHQALAHEVKEKQEEAEAAAKASYKELQAALKLLQK
jgi:hypothetical protein